MAIWQDLVDDHGFSARYASVRRFVAALRGSTPTEARVVITTAPGEEGQVDYGDGPMVRQQLSALDGAAQRVSVDDAHGLEGDACGGTHIGEPVPREHTFRRHQIVPVRRDDFEKCRRRGLRVAVREHLAGPVEDADV